ncbi:polymer-forming cytoskeletal protein [Vagococcus sp. BWB3-3]|uniref:Polymer-forming cytoskeletal protein n=1 Tax=Vagococcus allomyrinae TaxID=2794353 RepID=A0A940SXV5_9ENTE|nr:polymer-forming cytoskeletal protein [Vagococcus allomyrinae]MBP1042763.1 polymer-forming cytoskeletal protein [Vagococcus allomyrinae]
MKYAKIVTLAATLLVVGGGLAACSPDKGTSESSSASSSEVTNASSSTTEAVTGASISDKADVIEKALSADGNWIVAVTADVTFDNDLTVAGEFHNKGEDSEDIYRKLALYAQDDKRVVTDEYTLTAPKVIVESENFNIVHGTVKGDIEVKANGFVLDAAKVEGNIVFEKEEYKTSAVLDKEGASVTGEVTVAE